MTESSKEGQPIASAPDEKAQRAGEKDRKESATLGRIAELLEEQVGMMRRQEAERKGEVFGALFGVGDRVTAYGLDQFLPPDFLAQRGFTFEGRGANFRNPSEFGTGAEGYRNWAEAVFGGLWDYELILDESVRSFVKGKIVRETALRPEERKKLLSFVDGLFHVHNYNLAWLGSNGEMPTFAATPREGGIISTNEADRLSFDHLREQCRHFPGMARALSLTDDWTARQQGDPELYPEDYCDQQLSANQLGLGGVNQERVRYQKDLAMAWYRLVGFFDVRNYQEKNRRYVELMPTREEDLESPEGRARYNKATEWRRWITKYYSPNTFLMDPLGLLVNVWHRYEDVADNMRVGIRESKNPHNIMNLGWRPAAWLLLDNVARFQDSKRAALRPEELEKVTLANIGGEGRTLADLTGKEWDQLLKGVDFQMINIKRAMGAAKAQQALYECFTLNPEKFLELYTAIVSYARTDEPEDGIWKKSVVLHMVTRGTQEILESLWEESKTKLILSKTEMKRLLWQIKLLVRPAIPFSENQEKLFEKMASDEATFRAVTR